MDREAVKVAPHSFGFREEQFVYSARVLNAAPGQCRRRLL